MKLKNGSILIISNNKDVSEKISDKIKLLRECDTVKSVSFLEAISVLNSCIPALIILYWTKEDSVNIVKEIRAIKSLDKVPIIFVMDSLIEEILFCAFDFGIDEFFYLDDPDSIILMRIFLSLQKSILYKKIDLNEEIMKTAGIIDKKTSIYSSEYSPVVFKYFFDKAIEENLEDTVFLYVKPISMNERFLNYSKLGALIKSIPRSDDIVAFAENSGFYLILYNAGRIGAKSVANRIKKAFDGICEVYVNSVEITAPFEELQPILVSGINEQILAKNDFNFFYDSNIKEVLNLQNEEKKEEETKKEDIKEIYRKFEKIVIPVFYHFQTVYSNTLSDANIDFTVNEDQSYFSVNKNNIISKLIITFPMYSKVIIDTIHKSDSENPAMQRFTFDFNEFNEEKLSSVLKDFINEFSTRISYNTISETK